jgi:hypothetical protein
MIRRLIPFVFGVILAGAQQPKPPAAPPAPELTNTAKIALNAVLAEIATNTTQQQQTENTAQQLQQQLAQIDADVVREHPGFHLDHRTWTIQPDAPPPTTANRGDHNGTEKK